MLMVQKISQLQDKQISKMELKVAKTELILMIKRIDEAERIDLSGAKKKKMILQRCLSSYLKHKHKNINRIFWAAPRVSETKEKRRFWEARCCAAPIFTPFCPHLHAETRRSLIPWEIAAFCAWGGALRRRRRRPEISRGTRDWKAESWLHPQPCDEAQVGRHLYVERWETRGVSDICLVFFALHLAVVLFSTVWPWTPRNSLLGDLGPQLMTSTATSGTEVTWQVLHNWTHVKHSKAGSHDPPADKNHVKCI